MSILSEKRTGIVFDIQRFSIHDGPGIRTNVFLKGCPLRCLWCHNPESYSSVPEIIFNEKKCIGCLGCVTVCPEKCHTFTDHHMMDRDKCRHCGKCAEVCPTEALEMSGKEMTADQVLLEVMRDACFYRENGGMTISGGEPMYQPDFTLEILQKGKEKKLHICMETSGFCSQDKFEKVIPYVDIFLFDIKETDPARHFAFTGVKPDIIWKNLQMLDRNNARIILRCPMIPGYNAREDHLLRIAEMANQLQHVCEINIEPYHNLGVQKRKQLGFQLQSDIEIPSAERISYWISFLSEHVKCPVSRA